MSSFLDDIKNNLPPGTRCAETQEYMMNYLSQPEKDTTPGNKWRVCYLDNPNLNTLDQIESKLSQYGYIAIDIDYIDKNVRVGHACVICSN